MTTSSFRRARRPAPRMMVLANALQREATTVTFERPVTIADAIRRQRLSFRLPVVAVVTDGDGDGVPVLRAEWTRRKIRRGETLVFVGVPGKDGGSILGIIAGIALAVVAPWAGGAIAGALFGGSAIAASLISTGIILGGSFIINALFGPPKPEAFAAGERVSLANASANQARPLGIVPCLYGLMRYPPPPASIAYSEFDGNDQLLYQLHCVSVGVANPKRWEIGKTLAWTSAGGFTSSFTGIDIEIIRPGDAITLFPANVVVAETVARQVVPDPPDVLGPFTINDAGTQISEIAVDIEFPAGLYARKGNGGAGDASRQLTSRFREIDDEGAPLGDWSLLFVLTFTRSTATPQRFTRRATVPPGRYEVTLEAGDEDTSDDGPINRVAWAGLRGYLTNWTVPPGVTLIATKIRANDQLSQQSASQYFFTCQRCLPIYDVESQTWSAPAETSAIAWAAADILRNTDYGAGIDDALYDLAWLAAYDEVWSGRGDAFNGILDDGRPIGDALDTVLRAGRAYKVRLGGRIGFNRDEPKQIKRHVFGPGNTLRGSHGRKDVWFDEETPDHVRATYFDGEVWANREVVAAISSIGAEEAQPKSYEGITDREHVFREAITDAATNAYRRSFRSFKVEYEGRLLTRGDPVLYHDPLMAGVAAARLTGRDDDSLTIDRDFVPEDDETYHLIIRDKQGREWGPVVIDSFPDACTIALNAADRLIVESQHGQLDDVLPDERSEAARLMILAGDYRPFDGLLVSATPSGRYWDILLVNDDQRVHTADQTEIVPAPYTPPSLFAPAPEAPSIDVDSFYAVARRGTVHIELEAGWQPAPGAVRYVAELSYDEGAADTPAAASWTPVHDGVGTRFTAVIMPQPFTLRAAAIGVRQGLWRYRTVASVPAPQLPPEIVTQAALSAALGALMQQLDSTRQAAVAPALAELRDRLDALGQTTAGLAAELHERIENSIINYIGQRYGDAVSEITEVRTVAAGIADALTELTAGTDDRFANALVRFTVLDAPAGVAARVSIDLRAEADDDYAATGLIMDAGVTAIGGKPQIVFYAQVAAGDPVPVMTITNGEVQIVGARLSVTDEDGAPAAAFNGSFIQDLTVGTLKFVEGSILNPQVGVFSGVSLRTDALASGDAATAWVDIGSFTVAVDSLTENIIAQISFAQVVLITTISGASVGVELQFLRDTTLVNSVSVMHPGGPMPILPFMGMNIDAPPSTGTKVYKWQVRAHKTAGGSGNVQWAVGGSRASLFQPKTGI